jgi:hypothetical protein
MGNLEKVWGKAFIFGVLAIGFSLDAKAQVVVIVTELWRRRADRRIMADFMNQPRRERSSMRYATQLLWTAVLLICGRATAQSFDDLNLQMHGYATQSFIYTTNNNWNTTDSTDGNAAWTEAVVNLSLQPEPKLRVGIQARYFLLGDYGNQISLDWAQLDYKVNDWFGIRAGKVKTPLGLFNPTQDIDPAQVWVLLPQSIYPIASRNAILSHYGGVVYGSLPLGEKLGKLEYHAFGGERVLGPQDGFLQQLRDQGATVPNGITGRATGGSLQWNPPVHGLLLGAVESSGGPGGVIDLGPYAGTYDVKRFRQTFGYAKYERNRLMLAAEYSRFLALTQVQIPGVISATYLNDQRPWYAMATYKLTGKLTGGLYYSTILDRKVPFTIFRHQKDWALAARYDFSPFLYGKIEQHWIDGTEVGFSTSDNTNLKPTTRMTLLKLGVSF